MTGFLNPALICLQVLEWIESTQKTSYTAYTEFKDGLKAQQRYLTDVTATVVLDNVSGSFCIGNQPSSCGIFAAATYSDGSQSSYQQAVSFGLNYPWTVTVIFMIYTSLLMLLLSAARRVLVRFKKGGARDRATNERNPEANQQLGMFSRMLPNPFHVDPTMASSVFTANGGGARHLHIYSPPGSEADTRNALNNIYETISRR